MHACAFFQQTITLFIIVQEVIERVYDYGAIIRFLPPYPPDLNPIEEVFASVKHCLRQNHLILHSLQDPSLL